MGNAARAGGLMAFWADIVDDHVQEFREWHNCEHMPERCAIPGFIVGRRYCGIDGAPMFLMYYETEDAAVLASPAYHARLNDPTPWTTAMLQHYRNSDRTIFSLVAASGTPADTEPPYVTTCRFNLDPATRREVEPRLEGEWLDRLARHEQVIDVRLYRVDEEVSGIMTAERRIYGGGPAGAREYLVMIETRRRSRPDLDPGPELPRRDQVVHEFWLDMALHAPGPR